MKKRLVLVIVIVALIVVGGVVDLINQRSNNADDQQQEENSDLIQQPVEEDLEEVPLTLDQLTEEQIAIFEKASFLFHEEVISGEMTIEEMDAHQEEVISDNISAQAIPENGLDLFREWKNSTGLYEELEEQILAAEEEKNKPVETTDKSNVDTSAAEMGGVFTSDEQTSVSLHVNESIPIVFTVQPANAEISVSTNNPNIGCKLNGKELTITALNNSANGIVTVIFDGTKLGATCSRLQIYVNILPPPSAGELSSYKQVVWQLVNAERAKAGLPALEYVSALQNAVDIRAEESYISLTHTRPNGSNWSTVLTGIQYNTAGENIAKGQLTPEKVMTGWMNSSGHRANILKREYTGMAVGVVEKGGVLYWAQLFVG